MSAGYVFYANCYFCDKLVIIFYYCHRHNCWGILWAPISGLAMAELILDGHCASVDLSSFSLARFNNEEKGISKRGRKKVAVAVGEQW